MRIQVLSIKGPHGRSRSRVVARRGAVAALALGFTLAAHSGRAEPQEAHEHAVRDHVVVRVTPFGVEPAHRLATPQEAVVWLNYARFPVRITLGDGVVARVRCSEPSHFEAAANGRLEAPFVEPLAAASLCLLEPGKYDYVVEELDAASRPPRPVPAGRRFEGTLWIAAPEEAILPEADLRRLVSYHRAWAHAQREIAAAREDLARIYEAQREPGMAAAARARAGQARSEAEDHEHVARRFEESLDKR